MSDLYKMTSDDWQAVQLLIRDAKANGIAELKYKDLHIRFNLNKPEAKTPALSFNNTLLPVG